MNVFRLSRTYKSARRLQHIVNVFIGHGFGRIVDQIHLGRYIPFRSRIKAFGQWPALKGPTVPERLRMAFEELGPTFIKLAQILSSRPDLITPKYAEEFKKLQDKVPPFDTEEAVRIVEEELKLPIDRVFSSFSQEPVAAASIAQVHYATLLDGSEVIVKVQRPRIRERILSDIEIINTVASLMENYIAESRFFNPTGIVAEFSRTIHKELDFGEEARNCARFGRIFQDNPDVMIPKVFSQYLTGSVLVMERATGVRIDRVQDIDRRGFDRAKIAGIVMDSYLRMILQEGFFHADPHPGNIFVTDEGKVCFMDFGIVGRVSQQTKEALAGTLVALIKRDYDALTENFIELGHLPEDIDVEAFRQDFKEDIMDFIESIYGLSIKEINLAKYLDMVIQVAARHRLRMPADLILINKTMMQLDGLVRELNPEFNFIEASEPYAQRIFKEKVSPFKTAQRITRELTEAGEYLVMFPKHVRSIIQKVLRDDVHLKLSLTGLEQFIKDMDRSSNRIAFAMIVSAIILSAALMHAMGTGPKVMGLSILGIITFVAAVFLGIWLLISIIRSGRL